MVNPINFVLFGLSTEMLAATYTITEKIKKIRVVVIPKKMCCAIPSNCPETNAINKQTSDTMMSRLAKEM